MKFLFDLFPVILFFVVFRWGEGHTEAAQQIVQQYLSGVVSGGATPAQAPIMLATAIAIVATLGQILYLLLRGKKVEPILWVSLAIVSVFGGATIYFHDETFIKWKPTVLYWVFGAALFISQLLFDRNLIRLMMEKQIALPDTVWRRLSFAWAVFFLVMGAVNLYVAFHFATATWVNFKLFGFTGLMFAFILGQSLFLSRYVKDSQ